MLINIRCYEEQGMPPYCPWVQAIRSYVREHEPDQLRSEMGAGAADIAEVVSDVREVLPDLKPPPVQLGQWHGWTSAGRLFTQSFQFSRY